MTTLMVQSALQQLFQIAEAGEKGYATAAINMPDPALKILFKLYAQQRLTFKNEILGELDRLNAPSQHGYSILGAIHRGRVAIFAGMSTDRKSQAVVILKEVVLGEKSALRVYKRVLAKDLPEPTRGLVERQYAILLKVYEQVQRLRESENFRSAVRIVGSEQDANLAVQALIDAGFPMEEIERMDLNAQVLYQGKGATRLETILSGAFGGALWAGVTGMAAGIGVVESFNTEGTWAAIGIWLLVVLAFMLIGAVISSILAVFISLNITEEDNYEYPAILANAQVLVQPRAVK